MMKRESATNEKKKHLRVQTKLKFMFAFLTIVGMCSACVPESRNGGIKEENVTNNVNHQNADNDLPGETPTLPFTPEEVSLEGNYEITVYMPEGTKALTENQIKQFCEENPGIEIKATVEEISESEAFKMVLTDKSCADLFWFTPAESSYLVDDILDRPDTQMTENIRNMHDAGAVRAASVNGTVYGYPLSSHNGYVMFYDKSVIKEEHVDSLEDIIADCEAAGRTFSMELENGYMNVAFMFATGCVSEWVYDKASGEMQIIDNLHSEEGGIALKEMRDLMKSSVWINSDYCGDFSSSAVAVGGVWQYDSAKTSLQDKYGVAELPSFTADGVSYHMSSFFGYKLLGVTKQSDDIKERVLHKLALYLSGERCQTERAETLGLTQWMPSNREAQNAEIVQQNEAYAALAAQSEYAVPQGAIEGMWWEFSAEYAKAAKTANSDSALEKGLQTYENRLKGEYTVKSRPVERPTVTDTPKTTTAPKVTATPKPTATKKPKATATPKPTATIKPKATATPKVTSKSSYSAMDSFGEFKMEVKPGFASTATRRMRYNEAKERASILIPDLQVWSDGAFVRSELAVKDAYNTLYYHAEKLGEEDSLKMLQEYFSLLKKYDLDVKINHKFHLYSSYYYERYDIDYQGTTPITENATESFGGVKCDLAGTYSYEGYGDVVFGLSYPKEIGTVDTGERYGGKNEKVEKTEVSQNTVMPEYTITETGLDCFKITGWGWDSGDYVEICLHPDLYKKGDIFELKDFAAQADAGSGKLNSFMVASKEIGQKDWYYENKLTPNKENRERFSSIRVEVVEKSDTVTVIKYTTALRNVYGDDYVLDGLFAIKTGEEVPEQTEKTEDNGGSIGIMEHRCGSCNGSGVRKMNCVRCSRKGEIRCSYCSGDGAVNCTSCGGDGRTWDALNGEYERCTSCRGTGDKNCTKCHGSGNVDCTSCNGKGYTESRCSTCLGKGKW